MKLHLEYIHYRMRFLIYQYIGNTETTAYVSEYILAGEYNSLNNRSGNYSLVINRIIIVFISETSQETNYIFLVLSKLTQIYLSAPNQIYLYLVLLGKIYENLF
jgi:hypothetical protein